MMCEIQGPGGRYKLGEVIHGEMGTVIGEDEGKEQVGDVGEGGELALSTLAFGEKVSLDVESEMKELGLCVVICSVAWETDEGRRTFQRFFKYNVCPFESPFFTACSGLIN
jgi:hypothetical protein